MEKSQMKNIVVLKNLPSNLVEEAIVILKTRKTAKQFEYIDKREKFKNKESNKNTKDYIIREAESVVSSYINNVEKKNKKNNNGKINKKYKGLKIYSIAITILLLISIII